MTQPTSNLWSPMTKVWARELGRYKIRVNAVAPGYVATEMTRQMP